MENKKATEVGCQACKKGLNNKQYSLILLGFYILGTSIYGTIELVKYIFAFF